MIKPLSEDLRNKIAAGEVVENPSSVVKELIENSLDANSSKIYIVVEKGGQALIQLRDNGKGIPEEQLPSAILRFHTSKISTLENLFSIETLGFRGEALSSIASVSEMTIISNPMHRRNSSKGEVVLKVQKKKRRLTANRRPSASVLNALNLTELEVDRTAYI